VHLELPGRCRRVDAFSETDERHTESLEIFEQGDQMLEAASKPIQTPAAPSSCGAIDSN